MITRPNAAGQPRRKKKNTTKKRIARPRLDPARVYSFAEAAMTLGVSEMTLTRARDAGHLPELRAGYRVLFLGQALISWMAAGGKTGAGKER